MTGLPSEPMALVKDGTDSERTLTAFPLGINRADCISRQLSLMSLSQSVIVHSLLSPFLPLCSFRFPPLSLILYSLFENFHLITFRDILFFSHIGFLVDRESFFCEVSLDLANCKACLVNNLPLGNECLKSILHASLALFAPSALRKAEKSSRHLKAERLERKGK